MSCTKDSNTGVILTNKEGTYRLSFTSLDKTGMISHKWCTSDLKIDDTFQICYTEIDEVLEPKEISDYHTLEHDKLELDLLLSFEKRTY